MYCEASVYCIVGGGGGGAAAVCMTTQTHQPHIRIILSGIQANIFPFLPPSTFPLIMKEHLVLVDVFTLKVKSVALQFITKDYLLNNMYSDTDLEGL